VGNRKQGISGTITFEFNLFHPGFESQLFCVDKANMNEANSKNDLAISTYKKTTDTMFSHFIPLSMQWYNEMPLIVLRV